VPAPTISGILSWLEASLVCGAPSTSSELEQHWLLSGTVYNVSPLATKIFHMEWRLTQASVFRSKFHVQYSPLHFWPQVHRYTQSYTGISRHHHQRHACLLALLACALPILRIQALPAESLFWFKSIIVLPAVWGLFIFCMINTKGNISSVYSSNIKGSKGWFIMYAINSGIENTATLITNQPDIARWSKTKSGAQWSQLVTQPLSVTLSAALGILATAAINNSWGLDKPLWNPWDLLGAILNRY